ncbi:hypothetical protein GCM10027261_24900 [Geodermatophilus arenarius]
MRVDVVGLQVLGGAAPTTEERVVLAPVTRAAEDHPLVLPEEAPLGVALPSSVDQAGDPPDRRVYQQQNDQDAEPGLSGELTHQAVEQAAEDIGRVDDGGREHLDGEHGHHTDVGNPDGDLERRAAGSPRCVHVARR